MVLVWLCALVGSQPHLGDCTKSQPPRVSPAEPGDFLLAIKGHLRIKHYYGTSPNAVKTQIWIAVAVYLMVAILHKQLALPGSLHRTLQLLSVHPFEKMPLHELLMETDCNSLTSLDCNQLLLWDL